MLKKRVPLKSFEGYILLESMISLSVLTFIIITIVPLFVLLNHQRDLIREKMALSRFLFEEAKLIRCDKAVLPVKRSDHFVMKGEYRIDDRHVMVLTVKGKDQNKVVISEGKK